MMGFRINALFTVFGILLLLGLNSQVWGQTEQALSSELDSVREHRPQIKRFVQALIQRNMSMDLDAAMRQNGFRKEQLQEVLEGSKFKSFAKNVTQNAKMNQTIENFLDRILAPGVLEAAMHKRQQELLEQQRQERIRALLNLARSKRRRQKDASLDEDQGFWLGLWNRIQKRLYD